MNTFNGEASHNEEDIVASEQDGGYTNDQSNFLFNHHSFMDKTPTVRWSKQDIELFYEVHRVLSLHSIIVVIYTTYGASNKILKRKKGSQFLKVKITHSAVNHIDNLNKYHLLHYLD